MFVVFVVFCMIFTSTYHVSALDVSLIQDEVLAKAATNTNLALHKSVTASDVESGTSFTADLAVDGNAGTRWATNKDDGTPKSAKWLQIDFGAATTFDMVEIQWEQQNILDFELQVSDDARTWTPVYERSSAPTSKMDSITLSTPAIGTYMRIYTKDYNGDWPSVSIFEVSVYNSKEELPVETKNYQIYPTPQKVTDTVQSTELSKEVNVIKESKIDQVTVERIEEVLRDHGLSFSYSNQRAEHQTNLFIGVNGSLETADTHADVPKDVFVEGENKYDKHVVKVFENGDIVVLGENSDAAYYGLATLEQMLDQTVDQQLKVSTFEDYAFQKYRGAVEGYYGYPWSVEGTLSWMEYAKRYKMNVFLYGPKSDPYHLGKWDEDYPSEVSAEDAKNGVRTKDEMRQYAEGAAASKVNFVWVAHPAMQKPIDFTNEETIAEGLDRLMNKFDHMYQLGVRQFGIFVDDISNEIAAQSCDMQIYMLNQIQDRLYQKYNIEDAANEDKVKPLFFTPAWYTTGSSGAAQNLPKLKNVHPDVEICFTGNNVFSSISNASATTFKNWIGRTPVMWWNYPVNDAEDSVFFTNPINFDYSQDPNPSNIKGVLANPMNFSEASKVAFFGLADYTWNPQEFDAQENWEDSFAAIIPDDAELAAALRIAYGNLNDDFVPSDVKRVIAGYQKNDKNSAKAIKEKMYEIMDAVTKIESLKDSDNPVYQLLVEEAQTSFNKLYDMAAAIGGAMAAVSSNDPVEQMRGYHMANAAEERLSIPRNERYKMISLEGAGEDIYNSVLQAVPSDEGLKPFVPTAMAAIAGFNCEDLDTSSVQIQAITITPNENLEVKQGATEQFFASVQANLENVNDVNWSVEGASSDGTTISKNGILSVNSNELSAVLTVKATSVYDSEKVASVEVTITDREYVDPTIPVNLGPTAVILGGSGNPSAGEGPENLFDDLDTTKWCPGNNSNNNQWVAFDLGAVKQISQWQTVGGGIENALYAPSAYSLQVLKDENPRAEDLNNKSYLSNSNNWEIVAEYKNNKENITNYKFDTPVEGRYFRLFVANGSQSGAPYPATRIFETRIYGVDKAVVERTHTLTIDPDIQNGEIQVDAAHFEEGAKVNIGVKPDEHYRLKDGSLNYNGISVEGTSFLMPGEDVTLTAEFVFSEDTAQIKQQLASAITKAKAVVNDHRFSSLPANIQEMLKLTLQQATVVYENTEATIAQCNEVLTQLEEALRQAEFKADKENLKALIDQCEALDLSIYVEGVEALQEALSIANDVYANAAATQEIVDAAYDALLSAKNSLKEESKEVDKRLLSYAIEIAQAAVAEKENFILNDAWKSFELALADAEKVFADAAATQDEVNKAASSLMNRYEDIRRLPNEEMLKQLEDFIKVTQNIDRSLFSTSELSQIDMAISTAQLMLDNKDFNEEKFAAFTNAMGNVLEMIHDKTSEGPDAEKRDPNEDSGDKQDKETEQGTSPDTSDSTNTAILLFLMLSGAGMMYASQRRKNEQ